MARKEKKSSDGDAKSTEVKGQIQKCSSYFIYLFFLNKTTIARFSLWLNSACTKIVRFQEWTNTVNLEINVI